jgi:Fe-S cluster assembly protein SufD
MTLASPVTRFRAAFDALAKARRGDPLAAARERAMVLFDEAGLPSTREEDWRFTNLAPLAKASFEPGRPGASVAADLVAKLATAPGLVFVDGHFAAALSRVPAGVQVESLAAVLARDAAAVKDRFGALADPERRAFVALNAAFADDGVVLRVPRGAKIDEPIHALFVGTGKAAYPRNLLRIEEGAAATLVETYATAGDGPHMTAAVTEIEVGADATFEHYKLQREAETSFHVHTLCARIEDRGRFTAHALNLGGRLTRNDVVAAVDGEGIVCTLNGLVLARGTQHADNHTWIEHRKPNSESHELYKGIYDDRASGVFSGYIHVFQDAQKTDAYQSSKSLLLTDEATVLSQPQLEIYADDVKCSHGSTTGQMDPDALFYLRSRGMPKTAAQQLLLRAFAHDVTDRIVDEATRARVEALLAKRLPGGG